MGSLPATWMRHVNQIVRSTGGNLPTMARFGRGFATQHSRSRPRALIFFPPHPVRDTQSNNDSRGTWVSPGFAVNGSDESTNPAPRPILQRCLRSIVPHPRVDLWQYGAMWCYMKPHGATWCHMGATWGHMRPYGPIWGHMGPPGAT